jgi:hypothetical protein
LAEIADLMQWVHHPAYAVLAAVATSGVGYLGTQMWQKLHRKVARHNAPDPTPPLDWPDDQVAQAYPADALRKRLDVAPSTKIVVADRSGVRQPVEFEPGPYSAGKVDELLGGVRVGLNSGAQALQYRTTPFDLTLAFPALRSQDDFFDVKASLNLNVRVDPRYPERLMTWHVAHDRQVTMDRVRSSVESELKPHVIHVIRSLALDDDAFALHLDGKKPELQGVLNDRIGQHGLTAMITAFEAPSAEYENHRKLVKTLGDEQRRSRIEELLRLARIEKAYGDAAAEEAVKILIQEGQLKDLARMKELAEAQAYQRRREEAAKVLAKEDRESEGPRHEVLVELAKLREQKKPFSVDLRIVRPGGVSGNVSRDIGVHPPAYTAQNQIGSPLQLSVVSEIAGYLYLLNLGTSGKLWRLLPNPWRTDNRIAANQTVLVPNGEFELKFEGKPGTEVVMAIVSPNRVGRLERLPVNADGMSLSPEAASRDLRVIGQELRQIDDWAEATVAIETTAGQVAGAGDSC